MRDEILGWYFEILLDVGKDTKSREERDFINVKIFERGLKSYRRKVKSAGTIDRFKYDLSNSDIYSSQGLNKGLF